MRLIFVSPPGSGKGTQAELLVANFGLLHISTGDVLRKEIDAETNLGKEVKELMADGKLVPDNIVIDVIRHFMQANGNYEKMLFDGFPRTVEQAAALQDLLKSKNMEKLDGVIYLNVPDDELIRRLIERGGKTGRPDDQDPDIIATRLKEYRTKTEPLLEYYQNNGVPVFTIDGVGEIMEVNDRICTVLLEGK